MSVLSLGSTKAEFDAFLNDTYGIANNELTVKQAKSEATTSTDQLQAASWHGVHATEQRFPTRAGPAPP